MKFIKIGHFRIFAKWTPKIPNKPLARAMIPALGAKSAKIAKSALFHKKYEVSPFSPNFLTFTENC